MTWHCAEYHLRTDKHEIWYNRDVEECNFADFWQQEHKPNDLYPLKFEKKNAISQEVSFF